MTKLIPHASFPSRAEFITRNFCALESSDYIPPYSCPNRKFYVIAYAPHLKSGSYRLID